MLFAPLLAKTYRTWRIFDNPRMINVRLSNRTSVLQIGKVVTTAPPPPVCPYRPTAPSRPAAQPLGLPSSSCISLACSPLLSLAPTPYLSPYLFPYPGLTSRLTLTSGPVLSGCCSTSWCSPCSSVASEDSAPPVLAPTSPRIGPWPSQASQAQSTSTARGAHLLPPSLLTYYPPAQPLGDWPRPLPTPGLRCALRLTRASRWGGSGHAFVIMLVGLTLQGIPVSTKLFLSHSNHCRTLPTTRPRPNPYPNRGLNPNLTRCAWHSSWHGRCVTSTTSSTRARSPPLSPP